MMFCLSHVTDGFAQFSVTEHFKNSEPGRFQTIPGVFFYYDISPVKVGFVI